MLRFNSDKVLPGVPKSHFLFYRENAAESRLDSMEVISPAVVM
jgi:hypothetical protein